MAATDIKNLQGHVDRDIPALEPGDHLDQATFHDRYEAAPDHVSAELIGGIVYMPAALRLEHGDVHGEIIAWLKLYKAATSGTRVLDNATVILADDSEPQPDATLLILPEHGGQTSERDGYVCGPPELVVEVALSSVAYDLHAKRNDYERYGVGEYLIVILKEQRVVWLGREEDRFVELPTDEEGLLRSKLFGGLWLDPTALLACDTNRLHEALRGGLESDEHRRTVERIQRT